MEPISLRRRSVSAAFLPERAYLLLQERLFPFCRRSVSRLGDAAFFLARLYLLLQKRLRQIDVIQRCVACYFINALLT